jgi:CheY-like chemotaxis protein
LELAYLVNERVPAAVCGDVTRLRQILVNLLNNAIKFTERGEVVVSVTSEVLGPTSQVQGPTSDVPTVLPSDTGRWTSDVGRQTSNVYELQFSVRDTGIGIPPERIDRLFQSFSQVDASTTRRYGGTGLGLAISRRLSELMGGRMWVESEVGEGSTFHFTIRAEAAPVPTPEYLQGARPDLKGKRVLIVDDNETNRRILVLQTEAWGMAPRETASPAEALGWVRSGDALDVAILDMQMPEMDGLMLAAEIQKERDAGELPLVMLTSLGRQEAGMGEVKWAAFLTKPVKASQLYDALVGIFATAVREEPDAERLVGSQFDAEMGKRQPLRILLAEDNAVNQKLALRLLERMGYRADLAANGLEVLEALQRQTYDVVLMDVQMPEVDGLEATRRIRGEIAEGVQPQIIAMTANAMKEDREICLAAGMDDYISKPIRVEDLVGALGRCRPLET